MNKSLSEGVAGFKVHRNVTFRENPLKFLRKSSHIWDNDIASIDAVWQVFQCVFFSLFVNLIKAQLGYLQVLSNILMCRCTFSVSLYLWDHFQSCGSWFWHPSLCSRGCWESKSRYCSVCVGVQYIYVFYSFSCTMQSKNGSLLFLVSSLVT